MAEAEARLALAGSRVGLALRAPWPERRPEMPVLRAGPGLPAYAQAADGPMPNVVFALFGSHGEEQRRAVENVLREQRGAQPFVPIFLTNGSDFSTFREARLVFEYFPFVLDEAVTVPPASWSAYFLEALQLTMRRWGVQRLVRILRPVPEVSVASEIELARALMAEQRADEALQLLQRRFAAIRTSPSCCAPWPRRKVPWADSIRG